MRLYDNDAYREQFAEPVYDLMGSDGTNDRANQIIDAFYMAPEVEATPLPPNHPLTLEQLREMDGEPVWVEIIIKTVEKKGGWAICYFDSSSAAASQRWTTWTLWYEDYGKTWLAYRRKPEGG